jgi:hypothetical protein
LRTFRYGIYECGEKGTTLTGSDGMVSFGPLKVTQNGRHRILLDHEIVVLTNHFVIERETGDIVEYNKAIVAKTYP